MPQKHNKSKEQINVLSIFDSMKKRPGMYLGDAEDGSAVLNLIKDAIQPSLAAVQENQCRNISILILEDRSIEITDDGPGLVIQPSDGISELVYRLTEYTPATDQFGNISLDLITLNIFTSELEFTIQQDGYIWQQTFNGVKPLELKKIGTTKKTGTRILFRIDEQIIPGYIINRDDIANYLQSLSFLYDSLNIDFIDRSVYTKAFYNSRGLTACVEGMYSRRHLRSKYQNLAEFNTGNNDFSLEVGITLTEETGHQIGLLNNQRMHESENFVKAMVSGLSLAIKTHAGYLKSALIWQKPIRENTYSAIRLKTTKNFKNSFDQEKKLYNTIKKMIAKSFIEYLTTQQELAHPFIEFLLHQMILTEWRKSNESIGVPSSNFALNFLTKKFQNSEQFTHVVDYYREFELCHAACLNIQNNSNS